MNDSIHSYGYHVVVVVDRRYYRECIDDDDVLFVSSSPVVDVRGERVDGSRRMDGWMDEGGVWIADRAGNE